MVRDQRKNRAYFDKWIAYDLERLESMKLTIEKFPASQTERHVLYIHNFCMKHLQVLVSMFSRGDSLAECKVATSAAIGAFGELQGAIQKLENAEAAYPLDLDSSQLVLWLSYFAHKTIPKSSTELANAFQLLQRVPDQLLIDVIRVVQGDVSYTSSTVLQPLHETLHDFCRKREVNVVQMRAYLSNWYDRCRQAYWHDTAGRDDAGYFGYWCFEAALVAEVLDAPLEPLIASEYFPNW